MLRIHSSCERLHYVQDVGEKALRREKNIAMRLDQEVFFRVQPRFGKHEFGPLMVFRQQNILLHHVKLSQILHNMRFRIEVGTLFHASAQIDV